MENNQKCLEKTSLDSYDYCTTSIQTLIQWWDFSYEYAYDNDNKNNEISNIRAVHEDTLFRINAIMFSIDFLSAIREC